MIPMSSLQIKLLYVEAQVTKRDTILSGFCDQTVWNASCKRFNFYLVTKTQKDIKNDSTLNLTTKRTRRSDNTPKTNQAKHINKKLGKSNYDAEKDSLVKRNKNK